MSIQINKTHLAFVQEAKEAFEKHPQLETYFSKDEYDLIALRYGEDRDCIMVFELGESIANFVQQTRPLPGPRKELRMFSLDMERQLAVNEHKGGWLFETSEFLTDQLLYNAGRLLIELAKQEKDKHEITIRCANIANFAMMVADNEGEHL